MVIKSKSYNSTTTRQSQSKSPAQSSFKSEEENNSYSANSKMSSNSGVATPKTTKSSKSHPSSSSASTPMNNSSNTNNNYAAPHTPIASAKRPRNPRLSNQGKLGTNANGSTSPTPATPNANMNMIASTPSKFQSIPEGSLSPMHPARPMQSHNTPNTGRENREKDLAEERIAGDDTCTGSSTWGNFFSPVLSFLSADKEEEDDATDASSGVPATRRSTLEGENLVDKTIGTVEETESSHLDDIVYDEDGDVSMHHDVDNNFQAHPGNSNSK